MPPIPAPPETTNAPVIVELALVVFETVVIPAITALPPLSIVILVVLLVAILKLLAAVVPIASVPPAAYKYVPLGSLNGSTPEYAVPLIPKSPYIVVPEALLLTIKSALALVPPLVFCNTICV